MTAPASPELRSSSKDKLLFTPGPLTTSAAVKAAMQRDLGSRDYEFMSLVKAIRTKLLLLAGQIDDSNYTTIPMQGSGTFGVEAVIGSIVPPDGKLLVIINGAYGKRIRHIAEVLKIPVVVVSAPENQIPDVNAVDAALAADSAITTVAVVHCETTTGILNPIAEIGAVVAAHKRTYFVDAMSSFAAVPVDIAAAHIDYLVSSSNKCIEGVPGFCFILARRDQLLSTKGHARSVSLNVFEQWQQLEKSGQFRFTPPIQSMMAFYQALLELEAEGGVDGRARRYAENHAVLIAGMRTLGFQEYLESHQSYIITSYRYPEHPNFDFETFYTHLNERGFVIYPGKLSEVDCFRIGSIGRLYPDDMRALLAAIQDTMKVMGLQ